MPSTHTSWLAASALALALGAGAGAQNPPAQEPRPAQQPQPGQQAQPGQPSKPAKPGPGMAKPSADMQARCKEAMADREKMMAEARAADERLEGLVAKMNAASGQAKVDATAAVVAEIVSQRRAMRERMTTMQQRMMSHMMEHAQAGPQSMAGCPMMRR